MTRMVPRYSRTDLRAAAAAQSAGSTYARPMTARSCGSRLSVASTYMQNPSRLTMNSMVEAPPATCATGRNSPGSAGLLVVATASGSEPGGAMASPVWHENEEVETTAAAVRKRKDWYNGA